MAAVQDNLRAWLIPSQAVASIRDVRGRGAWHEVPWDDEGCCLNLLVDCGAGYAHIPYSRAIAMQHFVRPEFILRAHELVGDVALDLAELAYDTFGDASPWLDWRCLKLFLREGYDDSDSESIVPTHFDLFAWMQDRGVWDLPRVAPKTNADDDLILDITNIDVRFWERVHLLPHDIGHCRLAEDGVNHNPAAEAYIRFTSDNPAPYVPPVRPFAIIPEPSSTPRLGDYFK